MPVTYKLIASNTLSSSSLSVTFSSIPSSYTDLLIRYTARTIVAGTGFQTVTMRLNGSSAANYSSTFLSGNGSTATSSSGSSLTNTYAGSAPNDLTTSNVWGSNEVYIPSYNVIQSRAISAVGFGEDNSATGQIRAFADYYNDTAAITSVTLTVTSGFAVGSSFFLYGIKNS